MELDEMRAITLDVMENAPDVHNKDAILAEMFSRGIPFPKLRALFNEVGKQHGFIMDVADVKEKVNEVLRVTSLDFDTYDDVLALVDDIQTKVVDAPQDVIITCIRSYCKDQNITVPRKKRKFFQRRTTGSRIIAAAIEYAYSNSADPSYLNRQGLYDALLPVTKTAEAAYNKANQLFPLIYAVANELDFATASEQIKEMPLLERP